ncbi:MAG: hypothetical protein GEU26_10200 [Nitrososphaeraceae archaeon]|nr:hypothetical protein [Nitrososphaeraceae archaeon]
MIGLEVKAISSYGYKVIFLPEDSNTVQLYCACDYFQQTSEVCKHIMKVLQLEVGV